MRGKYRGEAVVVSSQQSEDNYVSVPLRGKYRGEARSHLEQIATFFRKVSVPLRGKYRGEAASTNPTQTHQITRFRPLAG